MKSIIAFTCIALMVGGCGRTRERTALLTFDGADFSQEEVVRYRDRYVDGIRFLRDLVYAQSVESISASAKASPIKGETELKEARSISFAYIDHQCNRYIDALFWANRTRGTSTAIIGATGATTATVLAVTEAATNAIAITAAAFGLATLLTDSWYETFLYNLEPSGVGGLLEEAQKAYRDAPELEANIGNEGRLIQQVQGYVELCTPPRIESLVNGAIKDGKVVAVSRVEQLNDDEREELNALLEKAEDATLNQQESRRLAELTTRERRAGTRDAVPLVTTQAPDSN